MLFPESFYPPSSSNYSKELLFGLEKAANKNILFCGCVKNCANTLDRNLIRLRSLSKYFNNLDIFVYENNSTDNTVDVLNKHGINHQSEKLQVSDHNKDKSLNRRKMMAYARNKYLEYAKEHKEDYDYFAVIDLDLAGGFSLEGVIHTISVMNNDSCYGSNSILYQDKQRLFFDSWAYRPYLSDDEEESDEVVNNLLFNRGDKPVRVDSCFGGLAIYPADILYFNFYYNDEDCDHVTLHRQLRHEGWKIYINPSQITLYTESYYDKCNSSK